MTPLICCRRVKQSWKQGSDHPRRDAGTQNTSRLPASQCFSVDKFLTHTDTQAHREPCMLKFQPALKLLSVVHILWFCVGLMFIFCCTSVSQWTEVEYIWWTLPKPQTNPVFPEGCPFILTEGACHLQLPVKDCKESPNISSVWLEDFRVI